MMVVISSTEKMIAIIIFLILTWLALLIYRHYRLIKMAKLLANIFLKDGSYQSLLAFRYTISRILNFGRRKLLRLLSDMNDVTVSEALLKKRSRHLRRIVRFDRVRTLPYSLSDRFKNFSPSLYARVSSIDLGALQQALEKSTVNEMTPSLPIIQVVAVAYERLGELKVFVQSWINQTETNWRLSVLHDGFNSEFICVMQEFKKICPDKIFFECTTERFNDYGHTLRQMGIDKTETDYILLTNADNYFIPKALEFLNEKFLEENFEIDLMLFNMVHSHEWPGKTLLPAYSFFDVKPERGEVDVSSFIVRTEIAKKTGFRDKTHDGDATYFEDIMAVSNPYQSLKTFKITSILFVHN